MRQYCRYCSHMCAADACWCEAKERVLAESTCKRPNRCPLFEFNELDAFDLSMAKAYRPRARKDGTKMASVFDFIGEGRR